MFLVRLHRAEHVRQYSIRSTHGAGWEVRLQEDRAVTKQVQYHDWHRVERAMALFRREVADLTAQGWQVVHS
jgi:hypothetical protein